MSYDEGSMPRIEGFQWDMSALMDPDRWLDEAKRGKAAGMRNAGLIGVSCPHCMRTIRSDGGKRALATGFMPCQCDDREYETDDVVTALGMIQYVGKSLNKSPTQPI